MQITDIKQQVKQKSRYSIFVDKKYSFSLSDSQIRSSGLKLKQEITEPEIAKWKRESTDGKLFDMTLRWLAIRSRSYGELNDYFRKKQIDEDAALKITEQLESFGYLDDQAFAENWVRNRRLLKNVSVRRLRQELAQKRIDRDIIDQVLEEDEKDDSDTLRELIEKKSHTTKFKDEQKFMAYLSRQGFSYSDIKQALEGYEETNQLD
ncbi:RecX family transcriptional regulator [Candidatus Saccharibacteria bacterium]|jgi:regulatory protein|nr:RecX family transcriptional regulator [Candidatus Saccharibacteria bacterium]MBP9131641.1 RecX family transcriptional regulator [Candidatus Saccharibacteria bacterium]